MKTLLCVNNEEIPPVPDMMLENPLPPNLVSPSNSSSSIYLPSWETPHWIIVLSLRPVTTTSCQLSWSGCLPVPWGLTIGGQSETRRSPIKPSSSSVKSPWKGFQISFRRRALKRGRYHSLKSSRILMHFGALHYSAYIGEWIMP